MSKRVTIDEIAKLSGVSKTTVSRVLSGKTNLVKEETLEIISKVIKEQNYKPSLTARSLRTKKTRLIGLILADIENPFYSRVARGVLDEAENLNYTVIISNSNYSSSLEKKLLGTLASRQIEGLLLITTNLTKNITQTLKNIDIPFILVDTKTSLDSVNFVTSDNYYGGSLAANYFIKKGHKKIGYLGCLKLSSIEERKSGFKKVLLQNQVEHRFEIKLKEIMRLNEIFDDIKELIKREKITGFFAGNDYIAIQILNFLTNELKLNVPEDISLIGYDNIYMSAAARVPLTTIMQPKYSMGKIALQQLIRLIDVSHEKEKIKIIFKPKLIERDSVKSLN